LISEGASPDGPTESAGAPLFEAISGNHREVVKILLENGSSFALSDGYGDGPLEYALHRQNDEIVYELLRWGARLKPHAKENYRLLLEQALKRQ